MTCPTNHAYDALFRAAGASYGVDPALVKAHAARESSFTPTAYRAEPRINDASYGLMQLLYRTAQQLGYPGPAPTGADRVNGGGLYNPGINIPLGAKLIAENLTAAGGDVDVAIAAYNEGIARAQEDRAAGQPWRTTDPDYVLRVKACWATYAADFPESVGPPGGGAPAPAGASPGVIALGLALLTAALTWLVRRWSAP